MAIATRTTTSNNPNDDAELDSTFSNNSNKTDDNNTTTSLTSAMSFAKFDNLKSHRVRQSPGGAAGASTSSTNRLACNRENCNNTRGRSGSSSSSCNQILATNDTNKFFQPILLSATNLMRIPDSSSESSNDHQAGQSTNVFGDATATTSNSRRILAEISHPLASTNSTNLDIRTPSQIRDSEQAARLTATTNNQITNAATTTNRQRPRMNFSDHLGQSLRTVYSTVSIDVPPSYHDIPGTVPSYHGRSSGPPPSYDDVINPNAPPPTYQSLFGQVMEARKTSNGLLDLLRRLLIILISTLGCTIVIGFLILIPFSMIIVGGVYLDDCHIENIPAFLLIGGLVWAIKNIISCYSQCKREPGYDFDAENRPMGSRYESLLNCFLFGWFIAGCVIVYRNYEPNYKDLNSLRYCNRTLYLYAFWLVTSTIIIFSLFLGCVACLMISSVLASRQSEDDTS